MQSYRLEKVEIKTEKQMKRSEWKRTLQKYANIKSKFVILLDIFDEKTWIYSHSPSRQMEDIFRENGLGHFVRLVYITMTGKYQTLFAHFDCEEDLNLFRLLYQRPKQRDGKFGIIEVDSEV